VVRELVAAALCVGIAGCGGPPPLTLRFAISSAASQQCPSNSCSAIPIRCDAVLSIRIFDPADPTAPYISMCQPLTGRHDLCSIAEPDLPSGATLPDRTLEIQVAVYAAGAVPTDPASGQLACPTDLAFAPDNLVVAVAPVPAIAGRAFYHPGDATTVVDLGCADLGQVNADSCVGTNKTLVDATIDDFDNGTFIPPTVADRLTVATGEPRPTINPVTQATEDVLAPADLAALDRTVFGPVPAWSVERASRFGTSACLSILEDGAQSTSSVTCRPVVGAQAAQVDIRGLRLAKATLEQVLSALGLTAFPDSGLVVGIVVDYLGAPAAGVVVAPSAGTVSYLSGDRTTTAGLTSTSVSGIFLSRDAPYGTTWLTQSHAALQLGVGYGGLVAGKASIVVLQLDQPTIGM
jgi:hypothetical protein